MEIHGGVSRTREREWRRSASPRDRGTSVLVATDAAGEGLNLQCAHLMVNYDLPWNPNRIEQSFGRIHRIGQTEVCHLWNLVADGTREGDVFLRLLDKMAEQSKAYQGKVFDVLGEAFEGAPLRDLLVQAVRYGDDPEVRRQLHTVIDDRVGRRHPRAGRTARPLPRGPASRSTSGRRRERVDGGVRSRLQPHFAAAWFDSALKALGGRVGAARDGLHERSLLRPRRRPRGRASRRRATGPTALRSQSPSIRTASNPPSTGDAARGPGSWASLLDAVADASARSAHRTLRDGVTLVDPTAQGPWSALVLRCQPRGHRRSRQRPTLSRRVAFVELPEDGSYTDVGPAYLDYRPGDPGTSGRAARLVAASPYRAGGVDRHGWALHIWSRSCGAGTPLTRPPR